jgi:hypothetical protein
MPRTPEEVRAAKTRNQAAWRARVRESADPPRALLKAVLAFAEAQRIDGSATAAVLALGDAAARAMEAGQATSVADATLAAFARAHRVPGVFGRAGRDDLRRRQAGETVSFVSQELGAGRASASLLRQGIRAVELLLRDDQRLNVRALDSYLTAGQSGVAIGAGLAPADLIDMGAPEVVPDDVPSDPARGSGT